MPEALKVHSGERVDLVDYVHGANAYTQASEKFAFERMWLDRRARIIEGFRIRVEDQTTSPGMITVFNGNALNREGQLVNNEQVTNDSRSVTLLGAGLTFYVEIEFIENASNTDARFFWDPTSPNTPPEPSGSEFPLNVATRLTPDWRVVTPVSTTGFEQSTNPNSTRIPLAVFATDGSNRISTGASNPGLALVRAASILEEDVSASDTELRVIDARMFPATLPFDITVDFGSGSPEARTVTALDRVNGICTVSVPLTNAHRAGAIIQVTSGSADLVKEKTDPSDPALNSLLATPGHPDYAQRFWQANEVRGSGLISSKSAHGSRDDLNVRSLKDHIDYLSAQLRELKFGSPRPEVVNAAPPTTFPSRPRYFDPAGSVQGARTNTVSIGNGTTSFGDFNGTDGAAVFTAALNALPASGGTIFVKAGTYTIDSTISVAKNVIIIGESKSTVVLSVGTLTTGSGIEVVSGALTLQNITVTTTDSQPLHIGSSSTLIVKDSQVVGQVGQQGIVKVRAENSTFTTDGTTFSHIFLDGTMDDSEFHGCSFTANTGSVFRTRLTRTRIEGCYAVAQDLIAYASGGILAGVSVENFTFNGNRLLNLASNATISGLKITNGIVVNQLDSGESLIRVAGTSPVTDVFLQDLTVTVTGPGSGTSFIMNVTGDALLQDVYVGNLIVTVVGGTPVAGLYFSRNLDGIVKLENSRFLGTSSCLVVDGQHASMPASTGVVKVVDCVHDNLNVTTGDVTGVHLGLDGFIERVEVIRSTFANYANTTGLLARRIGVLVENTASASCLVKDSKFTNIRCLGASMASGVHLSPAGGGHLVTVEGCDFQTISGVSGNHSNYGVYVSPASATNQKLHVLNNNITGIGLPNVTVNAAGIFVGAEWAAISGNYVQDVVGSGIGGYVSGVHAAFVEQIYVRDNYIERCGGSTTAAEHERGAAIRIITDFADGVHVTNNRLDQDGAAGRAYGIQLYGGATSVNDVVVTANTVKARAVGIHILRSVNNALVSNMTISNNDVSVVTRGGSEPVGVGIRCRLGAKSNGCSITGNNIKGIHAGPSQGISVDGLTSGADESYGVVISGNTLRGPTATFTSPTHVGILVSSMHYSLVSGNFVSWLGPGVGGHAILFESSTLHTGANCVGNVVTGDGTSTGAVTISVNCKNVFVGSNNFSTAPTPIIPSIPEPGWIYDTNLGV